MKRALSTAFDRRVRWRGVTFQVLAVDRLAKVPSWPGVFAAGNWTRAAFHVASVEACDNLREALQVSPALAAALAGGATDVAVSAAIPDPKAREALRLLLVDALQPAAQPHVLEPEVVADAAETWRRFSG